MLALAALLVQPPAAPKVYPPDPATAARIAELRADLDAAVARLPPDAPHLPDVLVYAKAVEWAVRHDEWGYKDAAADTLRVLEAGIARAKELAAGRSPWRAVVNRPVVVGYRSSVDGSVQPVIATRPERIPDFLPWKWEQWRWEVVLHGRDDTLNEVKFIARAEAAKPSQPRRLVAEPFGRGNNAYRWAGETDVLEARLAALRLLQPPGHPPSNVGAPALRGFSMGGAGAWHLGLHHPHHWLALQPGAGFTTTRGYTKLPADLPPHVEKMLTIYDAERYAENVANLPTAAYSGEKDRQKAAADNIERALAGFPEKLRFTHLVAPGLEHKQPPEWVEKCNAELAKWVPQENPPRGRPTPRRVRFVTHTSAYHQCYFVNLCALDRQYEAAVIDARVEGRTVTASTRNVRLFYLGGTYSGDALPERFRVVIDGQEFPEGDRYRMYLNEAGRWRAIKANFGCLQPHEARPIKLAGLQGPIDDAFRSAFRVVPPTAGGWHPATQRAIRGELDRAAAVWDHHLRGRLPVVGKPADPSEYPHEVLFGDPASNPAVAEAVRHLPIIWTADRLEVNGVRYDPTTHYPVLIYPSRQSFENPGLTQYVVLNSGHTFGAAEFRGSNAQLYPRLGDWAVKKVTGEVVASGLFDENWQFVPSAPSPKR